MPEPQTFPCFPCEGTGITHEGYAGHLCPDCDGLGVYEQPIENIEGVFLTRHRAGCRYKELVAEGLNPPPRYDKIFWDATEVFDRLEGDEHQEEDPAMRTSPDDDEDELAHFSDEEKGKQEKER